jgi:tetratricopeptide (TPR) repeat protein
VTACQDGAARVWDTTTGHLLQEPFGHGSEAFLFNAEFSPDGRSVISASSDKTARIWHLALAPQPLPNRLADLAEAVVGEKIDSDDSSSAVAVELLFKLKEELTEFGNLPSPERHNSPGALPTKAAGAGAVGENAGSSSYYRVWAQWFLAPSATRRLSPSSPIRMPEYVQRRIEENTVASLQEAVQLSPTNALAFANLARQILAIKPTAGSRQIAEADWYSCHAVELAPDASEVWWRRAEALVAMDRRDEGLDAFITASQRSPTNSEFWKAMGTALVQGKRRNEALQAFGQAIDLAQRTTNGSLDTLNSALLLRSELLKDLGRRAEARADFMRAKSIPARDRRCRPEAIDLTDYYNAGLAEDWEHVMVGSNLAELPQGLQNFAGVEFDVRGLIQLASQNTQREVHFPEHVQINLSRSCRRLHFLHAAVKGDEEGGGNVGKQIGSYIVHFTNHPDWEIPLTYGRDLRDLWWAAKDGPPEATKAVIAWQGNNPAAKARGHGLRLFKSTWENPAPDAQVESIDFISSMAEPAPFLIAITTE